MEEEVYIMFNIIDVSTERIEIMFIIDKEDENIE
jgi:hypothetical protein